MLIDLINEQIKLAMKNHDKVYENGFKSIKAKAIEFAREEHSQEIEDEYVIKAIKKELKENKQTIDSYSQPIKNLSFEKVQYLCQLGNFNIYINKFIPQINEKDLKNEILSIIYAKSLKDKPFGLKMKTIMKELGDKADGKIVSKILKELDNV